MAENKTQAFDKKALEDKIKKVSDYVNSFRGKPNMNPFLWLKKNVVPLALRLEKGDRSPELVAAINALKECEPIVNPNLPKEEPPKKPTVISTPVGLKLKEK